jgi:hypothetical protein
LRTLDELITRLEALESMLNASGGGGGAGAGGQPVTRNVVVNSQARPSNNQPAPSARVADEPPDFPYYDPTEPEDEFESEIGQPPPRAAQAESGAAPVTAGREVEAILKEIQKMNRGLVLAALEDAQSLEYREGVLSITLGSDDVLAKRVRDSGQFFREIGERLFGKPIKLDVRISGQVEERIDEAESKRRSLRERAMQNPAARLIMEKTKAELLWVKEKDVL